MSEGGEGEEREGWGERGMRRGRERDGREGRERNKNATEIMLGRS